ncbi:hypothetical protein [Devosia alba]|uniref:hypothetical protein n=1 Tax=Devosia alba TaxID=3152360 RepID=UPI00326546B7
MASTPYSVGTITVANGSTSVAGTDTFWVGKTRANDMLFVPAQGLMARITADPADNGVMAITAWAGTSLTDAAYEIIPASDTTTSAARLRDLLAQMSVIEANGRGLFYRFSDSVTDADPGAGYLRLNNIAIGSATAAYIDDLDANGAGVAGVIDSWDDQGTPGARGQLWVRSASDPSAFHALKVTDSVVDGTGYSKLTLVYIGGSGGFAADDELMVMFSAQGADGTNAILGAWQGPWVTAFAYDVDDLVEQGGSTYICMEAHTAGTFATDLAADKWDLAVEKGDTGDAATIAVGDVTTVAPGDPAAVANSGTSGAAIFDFDIPQGEQGERGINWQGDYSGATAYVLDDGVLYSGSSWRALQATTGNVPPALPTTSNGYWQLVARRGNDGAGTVATIVEGTGVSVDLTDPTSPVISAPTLAVGPASAVAGRVAVFDDTTGKLLADGGKTIDELVPAGYDDLLITVSLLALQVADNTNMALFLGDDGSRVADSFGALTYVDVAGGTNLSTATAGVLKPTVIDGADQTATHTGATQSGNTVSASTFLASYNPWEAFDKIVGVGDGESCWITNSATTGWLQYQFATPKTIGSYTVTSGAGFPARAPQAWTLQGSDTGAFSGEQATLDTRSAQTWSGGGEAKSYSISSPSSYSYYRLNVTANNGDATYLLIDEVTFVSVATVNDLSVSSTSFTAAAIPTTMKTLIRVKEVDAATAGTDYTMECSRDGGTTWASMTLTEKFSTPGGLRVVESADTDVSGQPSGTAPRWRFKTLNNKMVELHDAYFYWN